MICDDELHSSLEPNIGIVNVPDDRLNKLGVINSSVKVVPASVNNQYRPARIVLTE